MAVRIITDSGCDLNLESAQALGVELLPLKTYFGETEYLDGVTISHQEFFDKLIESEEMPHTSQVAPFEYEEKFKELKEAGDTAVVICLSSKLSGCYQSANIAGEGYEDCLYLVDSQNVCVGQLLLVRLACSLRDQGLGAEEIYHRLEAEKTRIRLIALLDTVEYLKKGGRISQAAAMACALLSIKPVIAIENGEVVVLGKARGSRNGNNMLINFLKVGKGIDYTMPYGLANSGNGEALLEKYLKDSQEFYDVPVEEIPRITIGSAIGTHIGPGAIAVSYFENK